VVVVLLLLLLVELRAGMYRSAGTSFGGQVAASSRRCDSSIQSCTEDNKNLGSVCQTCSNLLRLRTFCSISGSSKLLTLVTFHSRVINSGCASNNGYAQLLQSAPSNAPSRCRCRCRCVYLDCHKARYHSTFQQEAHKPLVCVLAVWELDLLHRQLPSLWSIDRSCITHELVTLCVVVRCWIIEFLGDCCQRLAEIR
jgi:hypothetical protein